jgi:outer membrane lipoprotein carrier protein
MKFLLLFFSIFSFLSADPLEFNTIQSSFTQTIRNETNKTIRYTGSFYATKDAKALWIYKTPIEKKIYFNHNQVVIIEPDLEQAIITTLEKNPNIASILKHAKKVKNSLFEATFDETTYQIHTQNNVIKSIDYRDKLENKVSITLTHQTKNAFLDDILFEPSIPSGYDIITQ